MTPKQWFQAARYPKVQSPTRNGGMTPKEKVLFMVEQGRKSSELHRQIMNAKPGEIMYWNFPNGTQPMARVGAQGSLNALCGPAFTHFGLGLGGIGGIAGGLVGGLAGGGFNLIDDRRKWTIDQNGTGARLQVNAVDDLFKTPDVPRLLEDEVRKHLPWGLPLHIVQATRSETCHGYNVGIWVAAGDLHEAKLVGKAIVPSDTFVLGFNNSYKDWRAIMLNDLADDINRRVAC